jgi:hypothetical protein
MLVDGRSSYRVQDVVFSMFLIVLCTNSIEWMVVEPADRQAAVMASLLPVLALKVPLSTLPPSAYCSSNCAIRMQRHEKFCVPQPLGKGARLRFRIG